MDTNHKNKYPWNKTLEYLHTTNYTQFTKIKSNLKFHNYVKYSFNNSNET